MAIGYIRKKQKEGIIFINGKASHALSYTLVFEIEK